MRLAGLVLGGMMLMQAPIVRRPPEIKGTQAPQGPEATQSQVPLKSDDGQVPTIRVQTRLVNVALNVVDAKGAPVGGLGRDDFEILENGKVQKISYFEKESSTPLSIVLAIDASESVLRDERLEKNAARHFVRALLRDQDELDLMDFSDTVREIVPFTNQKLHIESGLNNLQRGRIRRRGRAMGRLLKRRSGRGRWCTRSLLCRWRQMRGGIRVESMR
jgi:Ca-activated chloride channel homolog